MTPRRIVVAALLGGLLHGAARAQPAVPVRGPQSTTGDTFLTLTIDPQPPYVQSTVNIKVQVYSDKKLLQARVELPGNADTLVQRIGKDESSQETRNGRSYQVITRHYGVIPLRSGEIHIGGPVLDAEVADGKGEVDPLISRLFSQLQITGGLGTTRPLRRHGDPIRLLVRPRPANVSGSDWLPAQRVTLEDTGPPTDTVIAAGEPVARRLRLTAVGLSASQLPDLSALMPLPPGLKAYPDQATLVDEAQDGHIVGRRDQGIALIADHAGRYELPALRLTWWDAVDQQPREAVLPARTLVIAAGTTAAPTALAASAGAAVHSAPASLAFAEVPVDHRPAPTGTWAWAGLGFGLLGMGTLGAWLGARRGRKRAGITRQPARRTEAPALSVAAARRRLQRACRDNDARAASAALLTWARASFPAEAPAGLNDIARRLDRAEITLLLRDLDRARLSGTPWQGEALCRALPTRIGHRRPKKMAWSLPGLYDAPDAPHRSTAPR